MCSFDNVLDALVIDMNGYPLKSTMSELINFPVHWPVWSGNRQSTLHVQFTQLDSNDEIHNSYENAK